MQLWLPEGLANPLGKRMLALMFVRLLVLALLLGIIAAYYLREVVLGDFSSTFLVGTVAVAFLLSAVFLVWMRSGKHLEPLAHAQLVLDQLTWTAMVYLSGGVTSGSSSLYGLSCLSGVILLGSAGALSSALAGMLSYLALSLAFAYGVVLPPPDQSTSAYVVDGQAMVYPVFSTLMATGLVAMLAIYLAERLRTT
ncbi:MAG TPA: two-component sensor histidine kinase, partial [Sorangium sp.]|nr:two-component sensor histidine kinase [Sorangium sp.]